jgi:hypothetical protein
MRQGVPFIAPTDLGAVGAPFGRPWLPSIHGWTGLWTVRRQRIPSLANFYFWGHRTVRWGHQSVRCATWPLLLANVAASHCAAGTPDCSTPRADRPVNYSRRNLEFSRAASWPDRAPDCPVHTRLTGGWHRTVRCCAVQHTFSFFFLVFFCTFWLDFMKSLALRQIWLVYKTID